MVFQPPRPPQYTLDSHPGLFWIWTAHDSRIPVLFYNCGALERPVIRQRTHERETASGSKQRRSFLPKLFRTASQKRSERHEQEASVERSEIEELFRSVRHRVRSSEGPRRGEAAFNGRDSSTSLGFSMQLNRSVHKDTHICVPQQRRQRQGLPEEFFTILYSHGNAEDLASAGAYIQLLTTALGCSAMAYDYTGYGLSLPCSMRPSESRFYGDIHACYRYLIDTGVPPERVLLIGRSIGTGPTVELASRVPVGGVILIAPLMSCLRIVDPDIRCKVSCLDMFPSLDRMHLIKAPVLIIHGLLDDVVPICHGKRLYQRCPQKTEPLWLEKAGHNDIELHYLSNVLQRIRSFLRYCAAFFSERETHRSEPSRLPFLRAPLRIRKWGSDRNR